jgi:hypothetical protein
MKIRYDLRAFHRAKANQPKPRPTPPDLILSVLDTTNEPKPTDDGCQDLLVKLSRCKDVHLETEVEAILASVERFMCRECGLVQYIYLRSAWVPLLAEMKMAKRIWTAHRTRWCDAPSKIRTPLLAIAAAEREIANKTLPISTAVSW